MKKNKSLLNKTGLRKTKVREVILEILQKTGRPLSHQEIASKKAVISFDRVTIYRTLETLQKNGLLHKILGMDGVWRFCAHEIHTNKKCAGNHIHFLCRECNQMSCMPEQHLHWITPPKGATINSKQLVVHGICSKCNSKIIFK